MDSKLKPEHLDRPLVVGCRIAYKPLPLTKNSRWRVWASCLWDKVKTRHCCGAALKKTWFPLGFKAEPRVLLVFQRMKCNQVLCRCRESGSAISPPAACGGTPHDEVLTWSLKPPVNHGASEDVRLFGFHLILILDPALIPELEGQRSFT